VHPDRDEILADDRKDLVAETHARPRGQAGKI
jgi:hypothetical protein